MKNIYALSLSLLLSVAPALVQAEFKTPELPKGISYYHDVPIGMAGRVELLIDIAVPQQAQQKPAAAIVAIHGGAWRKGHKDKFANKIVSFAKRGYVAASLMYRLAPEHKFPAQVEDVKAAVRFLKANAQQFGINPNQIIAMGNSAGGHLAAMLGATGNSDAFQKRGLWTEEDSSVMAVVALSGPNSEFLTAKAAKWKSLAQFLGGFPEDNPTVAKSAMPISYLDPEDPPFFIIHGSHDKVVPVSMGRTFVAALQKEGVRHSYTEIEGGTHKLSQSSPQAFKEAYLEAFDWIDSLVEEQEANERGEKE